jgi:hypothetical protein
MPTVVGKTVGFDFAHRVETAKGGREAGLHPH